MLVILKESNNWGKKKKKEELDASYTRYIHIANTNTLVNKYMTLYLAFIVPDNLADT